MKGTSESNVASFAIDHRTLKTGVYLRSSHAGTLSWDLRFREPSKKNPMSAGAVHVIEHTLAMGLRLNRHLEGRVVAFCPMGCLTGFYLITDNTVSRLEVVDALVETILLRFPLRGVENVPGMNEEQCGNPDLCDIDGANTATLQFFNDLINRYE